MNFNLSKAATVAFFFRMLFTCSLERQDDKTSLYVIFRPVKSFSCRSTSFMKMMWKSLIQGHVDYASQCYQPQQSGELTRIENIFKTFTKKIPELNYWECLGKLNMNSQQRRFERYRRAQMLCLSLNVNGLLTSP